MILKKEKGRRILEYYSRFLNRDLGNPYVHSDSKWLLPGTLARVNSSGVLVLERLIQTLMIAAAKSLNPNPIGVAAI